ncbi:phosphatidylglycerol lysyltransferase domain-containing protein [Jatrophihabitans sp.]|uniref:phosphatidylglycerol lysyltransferase domain-containing protein n=1 Tax=Jatrophihabitans sp. TaxID=1932789 RepID=UPI0030C755CC|nr:hypothetical protein [Jatrophihabitans sp.]
MARHARAVQQPADEATWLRVRDLVAISEADPLAPFALRPEKQYVFSADGDAAVSYRVKFGVAMASGDPVGEPASWQAAVDAFVLAAKARKLRIAVIGAGERAKQMWAGYGLSAVPIGRDVVLGREQFQVTGRRYRNLRQAIQRSRNAGITVEFSREGELPAADILELRGMMAHQRKVDSRGFSMILGRLFNGLEPDAIMVIARGPDGHMVAAHRYLWAGKQDLSLDLPVRARRSPNGTDERLVAETIKWGQENGVERVSLAFAPFPDLFVNRKNLGVLGKLAYGAVHLLDPLIKVEALYRYLRKFHAFDQERYVMLRWRNTLRVALAALLLEFSS